METFKASDLYQQISGGTQRANPWAGILIEDIEKYRKNENNPWDPAYDIPDDFGAQLTNSRYEMYPIPETLVSRSPVSGTSGFTYQASPIVDTCPDNTDPQWIPYTVYPFNTIVKDKCNSYIVSLVMSRPEDNVVSPEFSQYFTDLKAFDIWDPKLESMYQIGDDINYNGKIYNRVNNYGSPSITPDISSRWELGLHIPSPSFFTLQ
jgi:hypothetical protein